MTVKFELQKSENDSGLSSQAEPRKNAAAAESPEGQRLLRRIHRLQVLILFLVLILFAGFAWIYMQMDSINSNLSSLKQAAADASATLAKQASSVERLEMSTAPTPMPYTKQNSSPQPLAAPDAAAAAMATPIATSAVAPPNAPPKAPTETQAPNAESEPAATSENLSLPVEQDGGDKPQ